MKIDQDKDFLYKQLVKLGDMMGDGLHLEPDGKWIEKEYRQTLICLGMLPTKNTEKIDGFMNKRIKDEKCVCGGNLKQIRKESFIAKCIECGKKYKPGVKK